MAAVPNYVSLHRLGVASISAANANRDGTGALVSVMAAGANGTRIRAIHIKALGTTTAGVVRLYLHDGSAAHLVREVLVTAITPSASVASFSDYTTEGTLAAFLPLNLPSGWSLQASTEKAEAFKVTAEGGNY